MPRQDNGLSAVIGQINTRLDPEREGEPDLLSLEGLMLDLDELVIAAAGRAELQPSEIKRLLESIDGWRDELAVMRSNTRAALHRGAKLARANHAYLNS